MNHLTFNNFLNEQITSSPLYTRAQEMANGKSPRELEQVARNICEQKEKSEQSIEQVYQKYIKNKVSKKWDTLNTSVFKAWSRLGVCSIDREACNKFNIVYKIMLDICVNIYYNVFRKNKESEV